MSSTTTARVPLGGGIGTVTARGWGPNARIVSSVAQLTPSAPVTTINLTTLPDGQQLGAIVTLYVNNLNGPIPVEIVFPDTNQVTQVPAYSEQYIPALTNGLVYNVTAVLIGELEASFSVAIQACNFQIEQALFGPFPPDSNTGTLDSAGNGGSAWLSLNRTVPDGSNGAILSYQSVEIDCSAFGGNITLTALDIGGSRWTVTQLPLTKSEFVIPATASGAAYTITAVLPAGAQTTATIPLRWRTTPAGVQTSYNIPLYFPSVVFAETSMSSGATTLTALAAQFVKGFFVDSINVFASGWSQSLTVALVDAGNSGTIWEGAFPSGNFSAGVDIGYVAWQRDKALDLVVTNAGAATGTIAFNVRATYLTASQNG